MPSGSKPLPDPVLTLSLRRWIREYSNNFVYPLRCTQTHGLMIVLSADTLVQSKWADISITAFFKWNSRHLDAWNHVENSGNDIFVPDCRSCWYHQSPFTHHHCLLFISFHYILDHRGASRWSEGLGIACIYVGIVCYLRLHKVLWASIH